MKMNIDYNSIIRNKWVLFIIQYWKSVLIVLVLLTGTVKITSLTYKVHKLENEMVKDIKIIKNDVNQIKNMIP